MEQTLLDCVFGEIKSRILSLHGVDLLAIELDDTYSQAILHKSNNPLIQLLTEHKTNYVCNANQHHA